MDGKIRLDSEKATEDEITFVDFSTNLNTLMSKVVCFCNTVITNNLKNNTKNIKFCNSILKSGNISNFLEGIINNFINSGKEFNRLATNYTYKSYFEYINNMFIAIFPEQNIIEMLLIPYCKDWFASNIDDFLKMPINYILESQEYDGIYNYDDIINKDGSSINNPTAGQGTGSISFKVDNPRHYLKAFGRNNNPYLEADNKLVFLGKDLTKNENIDIERAIFHNYDVINKCKSIVTIQNNTELLHPPKKPKRTNNNNK
jgi:hypothetical protein